MNLTLIILCFSLFSVTALSCLLVYKTISNYADKIRYLTFVEDLVLNNTENLVLRLSSKFWFKSFQQRADKKTINLVLRKLGHLVKQGSTMESRPYLVGEAFGNLSVINKKCEVRAIQYTCKMTLRTGSAHFIISLMEANPKIQGKHFVKIVKQLTGTNKDELIEFLNNDNSARRLLILL